MNKTDFLAKVSIFSHMKKADLQRIADLARYQNFREGEVIINEGDHDNRLFIVISGQVDAVKSLGGKNEMRLGTFGPHCYFGEMALVDDLARSVSVVAKEDTQVLSLEQWNLRQEIGKSPGIAIELLRMLSLRVRANEKLIMNTLGTLLPICANCKKIREDNGSWTSIEEYISDHTETDFTHSICPECAKKLYPEYYKGD
jgi:CRP-like cAMP-binding protein